MKPNRITELFGIQYPVIAGGMVWCSGWRLAAAVSNAGGLGLLGAGSMHPETLIEHIDKMNAATDKPWGINIPLMYPEIDRLIEIIIEKGVKIVFTSAGSPKKYTARFHEAGIKVAHVVSSSKFAKKCEELALMPWWQKALRLAAITAGKRPLLWRSFHRFAKPFPCH